jgi:heme-binding HmuY-like protein
VNIMPGPWGGRLIPLAAITALVASAVTLVALTLRQPNLPTHAPTPPAPHDSGDGLVGPVLYTVDATNPEQWRYFSLHLGSVIENAGPKDWDLAFRRYQVIPNGGAEFAGSAGIRDLGDVPFADVKTVPEAGYQANDRSPDPRNLAIASWYRYGFFSHVLTPKRHVWGGCAQRTGATRRSRSSATTVPALALGVLRSATSTRAIDRGPSAGTSRTFRPRAE